MSLRAYLWNDLQPHVNRYRVQASRNGLTDISLIPIIEPERQQSKRVLQRVARRERDGPQETFHSRDNVSREVIGGQSFGGDFQLSDDLKVGQCPSVPRPIPFGIELGRHLVIMNELCGIRLLSSA